MSCKNLRIFVQQTYHFTDEEGSEFLQNICSFINLKSLACRKNFKTSTHNQNLFPTEIHESNINNASTEIPSNSELMNNMMLLWNTCCYGLI
ncbi:unnamed protein product [Allacma fusca]|uniref:Uncharacterized protein n=1 Tax=Allacma fusca TaxID=39272 RepID=A0A8J2JHU8_9HEXA|nr:unnamed protein product [Allacma fusca]